jgi:hypothetical protein
MARKRLNVFSLSFLDAMTCGFGAVVLFFMIINANMAERKDSVLKELASEADRVELKVLTGKKNLVQVKNQMAELLQEQAVTEGLSREVIVAIAQTQAELALMSDDTIAQKESIEKLKADLKSLEEETKRLSAASVTPEEAGNRIRSFVGDGNRQYLTGLRMGGRRVLILVDASSSMLDRTIVNVIRRRNLPDDQKALAPKWRQTVATVDWLTAQLKPGTQFQIVAFNTEAWSLIEGSDGEWLTVADGAQLNDAVQALRQLAPGGGTSLVPAIDAINGLSPKPDNVYFLVDGLPTQGAVLPTKRTVTGVERRRHFNRAVRRIPVNVPINVIMYPMEGDPLAAPSYWELALRTGGSFMAPSDDWP